MRPQHHDRPLVVGCSRTHKHSALSVDNEPELLLNTVLHYITTTLVCFILLFPPEGNRSGQSAKELELLVTSHCQGLLPVRWKTRHLSLWTLAAATVSRLTLTTPQIHSCEQNWDKTVLSADSGCQ